jgi:hypothetical protein
MSKKIFKGLLSSLLGLLLLFLLAGIIFSYRYSQWYGSTFNKNTSETSPTVCLDSLAMEEELEEIIEERIKNFILSDSRTDFIVFSVEEVLYVLSSNIETTDPFEVNDVCLAPSRGLWQVYLKYSFSSIQLPWVVMDVVKDNRETAELYVNEIRIGDSKIPDIIADRIIIDINKGISDAVIMLNENRFLGRTIENIELLNDKVVFKGSL